MARRFALMALIGTLVAMAPLASHAACGTVTTRNSAKLAFGDVAISMYENQPNDICGDGTVTQGAFDRRLTITVGGVAVCDRTDNVDPSFDPFFLGAGLHPDPAISCGADFSVIGLTEAAKPDPSTVVVDPAGPYAQAGLTKKGITETPGRYWYGGSVFELPQDTSGTITRGAGVGA